MARSNRKERAAIFKVRVLITITRQIMRSGDAQCNTGECHMIHQIDVNEVIGLTKTFSTLILTDYS